MKKKWLLATGGLLAFYAVIISLVTLRRIAFSEYFLFAGIVLIGYYFLEGKIKNNKYLTVADKIIKISIAFGLIFFIVIEGLIISFPKRSNEKVDYIVVLGAGLNNGNELSETLKDRLDTALYCLENNSNDSVVVVSGGQGSDELISEAAAMEGYLIENGVDKNKIIKEDKSRNTSENFKFSKEKIEYHSNKDANEVSIKIITTDFHAYRSNMLAKRVGFNNVNVYTCNTVPYLIPVFYARESVAVVKSYLLDK